MKYCQEDEYRRPRRLEKHKAKKTKGNKKRKERLDSSQAKPFKTAAILKIFSSVFMLMCLFETETSVMFQLPSAPRNQCAQNYA